MQAVGKSSRRQRARQCTPQGADVAANRSSSVTVTQRVHELYDGERRSGRGNSTGERTHVLDAAPALQHSLLIDGSHRRHHHRRTAPCRTRLRFDEVADSDGTDSCAADTTDQLLTDSTVPLATTVAETTTATAASASSVGVNFSGNFAQAAMDLLLTPTKFLFQSSAASAAAVADGSLETAAASTTTAMSHGSSGSSSGSATGVVTTTASTATSRATSAAAAAAAREPRYSTTLLGRLLSTISPSATGSLRFIGGRSGSGGSNSSDSGDGGDADAEALHSASRCYHRRRADAAAKRHRAALLEEYAAHVQVLKQPVRAMVSLMNAIF